MSQISKSIIKTRLESIQVKIAILTSIEVLSKKQTRKRNYNIKCCTYIIYMKIYRAGRQICIAEHYPTDAAL